MLQATLKEPFTLKGLGVHSGKECSVTVYPTEEDKGIIFKLKNSQSIIRGNFANVSDTRMCTQISNTEGQSLKTIEHLVATLYGLKISNAFIEVEGEEIPILDGSAKPFASEINKVGVELQSKNRKIIKIIKKVKVTDNEKYEELSSGNSFTFNIKCDFVKKGLLTSEINFDLNKDNFYENIAPARTFGFISDVEILRKNNLALGASLENTVVYDNYGKPMNAEGLRFENESVKHKLLDVIGDLSLSGYWIQGHFSAFCPSHKLNNILLKLLFSNPENYEIL